MDLTPYLILVVILAIYFAIVLLIKKKNLLASHGVSIYGPFIMWKTQAGKEFIDRLSRPKRFWRSYATVAKVICLLVGIFIMSLLVWEATLVSSIPADKAPTPDMILGIPGINRIIPVGYGILGLIVAVVFHEFAHGILTRTGGMSLRALGVILLVVPLGAFVEPDEDQLAKTERRKRSSVYAVGPATNIVLALICALLFSSVMMTSVVPVRDGPIVLDVVPNGPAAMAGLQYGAQVVELNGQPIATVDQFSNFNAPDPNTSVTITYYYKGELLSSPAVSGVTIASVTSGEPAALAGMQPGMIVASLNGTVIRNQTDLSAVLSLTKPGETIGITVLALENGVYCPLSVSTITLAGSSDRRIGFLGITSTYIGVSGIASAQQVVQLLAHPFANAKDPGTFIGASLRYIALPLLGLSPIESPISDLFTPVGLFGGVPAWLFWVVANSFYWIFWINLMVGMTNVLPAVPLDGGYLFRDGLDYVVRKVKKNASEADTQRYVSIITIMLAVTVFMLIIWQLVGPRLL
jgi:membrane-associated protease RseP (regulator of RpoE activity)